MVYRSNYKRPQFPPKVDFGGPNYRLHASHVASHVDWPSRTLLKVRPARQDAVLPRRRTTTALAVSIIRTQQLSSKPVTSVYRPTVCLQQTRYSCCCVSSSCSRKKEVAEKWLEAVGEGGTKCLLSRGSLGGEIQDFTCWDLFYSLSHVIICVIVNIIYLLLLLLDPLLL